MARWLVLNADEVVFDEVLGADVNDGVVRYVLQRKEDGSFGGIQVGGRTINPAGSAVYVQAGGTVHVQVG